MNLRKVVVYKYDITKPLKYGAYSKVPDGHGLFHQFGCDFKEFETGPGNFTTAIIEMPDGSIKNVPVELIIFND